MRIEGTSSAFKIDKSEFSFLLSRGFACKANVLGLVPSECLDENWLLIGAVLHSFERAEEYWDDESRSIFVCEFGSCTHHPLLRRWALQDELARSQADLFFATLLNVHFPLTEKYRSWIAFWFGMKARFDRTSLDGDGTGTWLLRCLRTQVEFMVKCESTSGFGALARIYEEADNVTKLE